MRPDAHSGASRIQPQDAEHGRHGRQRGADGGQIAPVECLVAFAHRVEQHRQRLRGAEVVVHGGGEVGRHLPEGLVPCEFDGRELGCGTGQEG